MNNARIALMWWRFINNKPRDRTVMAQYFDNFTRAINRGGLTPGDLGIQQNDFNEIEAKCNQFFMADEHVVISGPQR